MLGSLDGARVLDLYAGSGAVGLEALSRGADHVLLVEQGARATRVIRENIEAIGLPGAVLAADRVERAEVRIFIVMLKSLTRRIRRSCRTEANRCCINSMRRGRIYFQRNNNRRQREANSFRRHGKIRAGRRLIAESAA